MGSDSPALPIARHIHVLATWNFVLFGVTMVLFGTVRANGAVWAPLIILPWASSRCGFGWIFATYDWLGADALWTSFPVSSLANAPRGRLLLEGRLAEGATSGRRSSVATTNASSKPRRRGSRAERSIPPA